MKIFVNTVQADGEYAKSGLHGKGSTMKLVIGWFFSTRLRLLSWQMCIDIIAGNSLVEKAGLCITHIFLSSVDILSVLELDQ